ncbi:uncharacterized protein LOC113295013 [Papaver somniferum]|uniref:uncharacterized protein LOC113295013 n=1 Tax=Papaver somniferum TaxID=3469 RepID=UPI000E702AB5|nr:uncharacterized protein LOC113295013 [Papaver somniferum]
MKGPKWGNTYDLQILLHFKITGIAIKMTRVKQCFFKLPGRGKVMICCDGASKGNPGIAGLFFVERNEHDKYLGAGSGGLGITTNYLAEVMALIVAGEWAVQKKYEKVCFRLDSKAFLLAFSYDKIPWIVENRWKNIRKHLSEISFIHSYREINFSADKMANKGVLLARGTIIYYEEKPSFLNQLEEEDGIYFRFSF